MPRWLAFTLVFAATGCDASLRGGDIDAASADARRIDGGMADAAPDAPRMCTAGTGATLAPDGSCLVHVTTVATYAAAKAECGVLAPGGHLAYLKTAQLDTFAESFIGVVDTWIGGNDLITEMAFVWDDGAAFSFTNWHTGEPNNGGGGAYQEDCVIVAGSRVGKQWDDRPCDTTEVPTSGNFAYLCQY